MALGRGAFNTTATTQTRSYSTAPWNQTGVFVFRLWEDLQVLRVLVDSLESRRSTHSLSVSLLVN